MRSRDRWSCPEGSKTPQLRDIGGQGVAPTFDGKEGVGSPSLPEGFPANRPTFRPIPEPPGRRYAYTMRTSESVQPSSTEAPGEVGLGCGIAAQAGVGFFSPAQKCRATSIDLA